MAILASLTPPADLRVLVTGGADGIGRRIADGFLQSGGQVHVADVDPDAAATFGSDPFAAGRRWASVADAADGAAMRDAFDAAMDRMGGLDVVVANAGVAGPTAAVEDIEPEDWDGALGVNLRGVWLAARFGAAPLKASRGSFIAIGSVAGRLGYAFRTPYAASKWGVVGLAKSLAAEWGPDGVRVNAILPGIVRGPRIERVIAARAAQLGLTVDEMRARFLEKTALRRMVAPEDVAALCLFLCAPGGSNITGQALSVCAGVETL
jgi:NAD(P)-dependent dehydrogenase (short-subunit alcohol dehydrogenase family)